MASFWQATATGVTLRLRVTPNAGRDAIDGVETRADGEPVLRLRVRAVPDKGRANAAVIALLAAALAAPKSRVTVLAGATARLKTVAVVGDAAELTERLRALVNKRVQRRARIVGAAIRAAHMLSIGMAGIIDQTPLSYENGTLVLTIPPAMRRSTAKGFGGVSRLWLISLAKSPKSE